MRDLTRGPLTPKFVQTAWLPYTSPKAIGRCWYSSPIEIIAPMIVPEKLLLKFPKFFLIKLIQPKWENSVVQRVFCRKRFRYFRCTFQAYPCKRRPSLFNYPGFSRWFLPIADNGNTMDRRLRSLGMTLSFATWRLPHGAVLNEHSLISSQPPMSA